MSWPWWAVLAYLGAAAVVASLLVGVALPFACWAHDRRAARRARISPKP